MEVQFCMFVPCPSLILYFDTFYLFHSMGDSITEGTIKEWQKNVGDAVKVDEVVVVIETDKVCL